MKSRLSRIPFHIIISPIVLTLPRSAIACDCLLCFHQMSTGTIIWTNLAPLGRSPKEPVSISVHFRASSFTGTLLRPRSARLEGSMIYSTYSESTHLKASKHVDSSDGRLRTAEFSTLGTCSTNTQPPPRITPWMTNQIYLRHRVPP
jgi:hypothetical protein